MMKSIDDKYAALQQAQIDLISELELKIPKRSYVQFFLSSRQKRPSSGEVVGYRESGYLVVRLHQVKPDSSMSIRGVHYSDVFNGIAAESE
jgi:hypothetical protein